MSPRWGSNTMVNLFYNNVAPLGLKGRPPFLHSSPPRRIDFLADTLVFVLESAAAERDSCRPACILH